MKIALTDCYLGTRNLRATFESMGHDCVIVQSESECPPSLRPFFVLEPCAQVVHHGDLDATCAALTELGVQAVVAGNEVGVEFADVLSERLGLRTNGTALSLARRNKYFMIERLRECGLAAAQQLKTSSWEEAHAWIEDHGKFPVVVKPLASAGTDGVTICRTMEEARQAFLGLVGTTSMLGLPNDEVLVQEFLKGREWVVNAVSCDGRRAVVEIFKYGKRTLPSGAPIYDCDELIAPDAPEAFALTEYCFKVLEALGIQNGPSHAEIMWVEGRGPVLVEVGARLDGTNVPEISVRTVGRSQAALTVLAFTDPAAFAIEALTPYRVIEASYLVSLISDREGTVVALPLADRVRELPSFCSAKFRAKPGSVLKPTVDMATAPGLVYLIHRDPAVLAADLAQIREWERTDGYVVQ